MQRMIASIQQFVCSLSLPSWKSARWFTAQLLILTLSAPSVPLALAAAPRLSRRGVDAAPSDASARAGSAPSPNSAANSLAPGRPLASPFVPVPQNSSNGISASVGYADNSTASPNFPTPWQGSPNVVFIGDYNDPYNAGAIRLDNTTSSPINVDSVVVNLQRPGPSFNLWGSFTIPALGSAILTQTSANNFATAGYPIVSCGGQIPSGDTRIPQITVTVGGNPNVFSDALHVLDTGGFDLGCRGNRSLAWRPVGTTGINSPSASMTLGPSGTINATNVPATFTAQVNDAANFPLANAGVSFHETLVNRSGQSATNAQGQATFSYASGLGGSDALQASLTNVSGGAVTAQVTVNWSGAGACPTNTI